MCKNFAATAGIRAVQALLFCYNRPVSSEILASEALMNGIVLLQFYYFKQGALKNSGPL